MCATLLNFWCLKFLCCILENNFGVYRGAGEARWYFMRTLLEMLILLKFSYL